MLNPKQGEKIEIDTESAYVKGEEVDKILFFDDKKTFRIYYKDGCVTDGEII